MTTWNEDAACEQLSQMIQTAVRLIGETVDSETPLCDVHLYAKHGPIQINMHVSFEPADVLNPQTTCSAREAFDSFLKPCLWHTYLHPAAGYRFPASSYSGSRDGWRLTVNGRGGFIRKDELGNLIFSDTPT